jgi:hypothetical protein
MQAFDAINDRYGIKLGCAVKKLSNKKTALPWELKRNYLSPCYTTKIDIPLAY